ncbi:MAG: RcpC/CpaB family pilus assembly protein [Acidimicrobiia bacterium]|nr:RcpC/CpaB family pilus assembly protein [Acidimicrobiia bacterium]
MNKRLIGMVVSVALAAIGTFSLLTYVKGADERALAGEETVEVLVVDTMVAKGTPISEVAKAVTTEWVPVKVRAEGSVSTLNNLSGTVAAVDLLPGEQVVAARFVNPVDLAAETIVAIPDGLLEVTIALDPQRAVGGQPLPGDLVAVVASFNDVATEPVEEPSTPIGITTQEEEAAVATLAATHIILHKVLIANVQANEQLARAEQADATEVGFAAAPTGSLLITFAVSAPDVEKLVFAAEHGRIWLAREPADAPEDGTSVQTNLVIYR